MSRKSAREAVVHMIFEYGYNASCVEEILQHKFSPEFLETVKEDFSLYSDIGEAQHEYVRKVFSGSAEHLEEIDACIKKNSIGWDPRRISRVAMAIMRVAIYEAKYMDDIPASVAINEAVEIAKKYETAETVAFINGVLGGVVREEPEA